MIRKAFLAAALALAAALPATAHHDGDTYAKLIFNSNPGLLRIPVPVCGGF